MNMHVEPMTAAHLDGIAAIERECFAHPWTKNDLVSALNNENALFFVATDKGAVIGYIGAEIIIDEGYIYNVAVTESCRGRGVGSALIEALVNYAKRSNLCFLTLEVRESNAPARSLYGHFGFIKAGERKAYYSDPTENAVLMTKFF